MTRQVTVMRRISGQAMAEALLALAVLGLLFAAQAMVGRLQDKVLATGVEARAAAFAVAYRLPSAPAAARRQEEASLPVRARLGQESEAAAALRGELLSGPGGLPLGLVVGNIDAQANPAGRYAILDGAGDAVDAEAARKRLEQAGHAWADAARGTARAARPLAAMARVDAAWGRPAVEYDWLNRWVGKMPSDLHAGRP